MTALARPTTAEIHAAVGDWYGIAEDVLLGPSRLRIIARPRQLAMWLAHRCAGRSLPQIGARFGRDHTTVRHAVVSVDARLGSDPELEADFRAIAHALAQAVARRLIGVPEVRHG